jgi:hypothetical protein
MAVTAVAVTAVAVTAVAVTAVAVAVDDIITEYVYDLEH